MSAIGVKRTSLTSSLMSANDPKRTSAPPCRGRRSEELLRLCRPLQECPQCFEIVLRQLNDEALPTTQAPLIAFDAPNKTLAVMIDLDQLSIAVRAGLRVEIRHCLSQQMGGA